MELENIRSFGTRQCFDLLDAHGRPAQWTLILGDNGVGKTTLLQCLARMRPVVNEAPDDDDGAVPHPVEPELFREEDNATLKAYTRSGTDGPASLRAELIAGATFDGSGRRKRRKIVTAIEITRSKGRIKDVIPTADFPGKPVEPLVLAYGAGRHMGRANLERSSGKGQIDSLFDAAAELFDPEETLSRLDYLRLKKRENAKSKLASLKALLVEILPYLDHPDDIDIRGPRLPGTDDDEGGVWIKTPFGVVPITRMSLGYQTVMAWTADIAWRLLNHYPDCPNPLLEPAIVIVDEIDLHLHPQWQRSIRRHLTTHFPAVQFIATAHSPLMAQDALDTNLAVLHADCGEVAIVSDPAVVKNWRLDQILTSELFGLESARPIAVEKVIERRNALATKSRLSAEESTELAQLNAQVHNLPTAEREEDQRAMDIIRRAAAAIGQPGTQ
ncbi:AAA family ATPase [Sphingopyxis lindanitolerans]|uniref:AAA family ATPase n=1 Tax=Sphingopyxis lindanitolerans TaxID=2054227 RepID=UPI001304FF87|nr:AAA family ATPase [Sphingopyxis lindanitolerans]